MGSIGTHKDGWCAAEHHHATDHWDLRPTPLPWLPVLSNIEPPPLRRKVAVDKLISKATLNKDWGVHSDISHLPRHHDIHSGRTWNLSTFMWDGRKTGKPPIGTWPCYPAVRVRPASTSMVDTKPVPHRRRPLQSLSQQMGSLWQRALWLWWGADCYVFVRKTYES